MRKHDCAHLLPERGCLYAVSSGTKAMMEDALFFAQRDWNRLQTGPRQSSIVARRTMVNTNMVRRTMRRYTQANIQQKQDNCHLSCRHQAAVGTRVAQPQWKTSEGARSTLRRLVLGARKAASDVLAPSNVLLDDIRPVDHDLYSKPTYPRPYLPI